MSSSHLTTMSDLIVGAGLPHLHNENRNIGALEKMEPSLIMLKTETARHHFITQQLMTT